MLRGLYTATQGLMVLNVMQEVTANNLANANSVGYKKDTVVSTSFPNMLLYKLEDPNEDKPVRVGNISTGVRIAEVVTDYSKGVQREAESGTGLAVIGEGYFTVNTPQGERYTRNGEFSISTDGKIVSTDGYPLLGQNGEITVDSAGYRVSEDGAVYSGGKKVDELKIVYFAADPAKEGSSLFRGEDPQDVANPRVMQGFLEESNASPLEETIQMIAVMRAYEANQKVIQTNDSTLEKAVNEIARL